MPKCVRQTRVDERVSIMFTCGRRKEEKILSRFGLRYRHPCVELELELGHRLGSGFRVRVTEY